LLSGLLEENGAWSCRTAARRSGTEWRLTESATPLPPQTSHPVLCSDERLRHLLHITQPDPLHALTETVHWLWAHRDQITA
jgi:hypothetical protein